MLKKIAILFLCFYSSSMLGQKIEGIVKDTEGIDIPFATVSIKTDLDTKKISEYVFARKGKFSFQLKKEYSKIIIEVKANKYILAYEILDNLEKDKTYSFDFYLQKEEVNELEEITIKANKRFFEEKGDTAVFDASKYVKEGDKKVQDLLKNIPGIDVNEKTGRIKYKGKSIETIMLDGDDLFGSNYTLGSKNINIGIVEKIEAIENYSENHLLKGIEHSEKVAINLKLKEGKIDLSGSADFGGGIDADGKILKNVYATVLGIAKKHKSFGVLSYNNMGINHSPFDFSSSNFNIEASKENELYAPKLLSDRILVDDRSNNNDMYFGNISSLWKLNSKWNIKLNLYYIKDKIRANSFSKMENQIEETYFVTSDAVSEINKPTLYRSDLEMKYHTSSSSLLEYKGKIFQKNRDALRTIVTNSSTNYHSNINTEEIFFKQNLIYTQKLSNSSVLQFIANYSKDNAPQEMKLEEINLFESYLNQKSNFEKEVVSIDMKLFGKINKTKYSLNVGYKNLELPFISSNNEFDYNNDLYFQKIIYQNGFIKYSYKSWSFIPSYKLNILQQKLNDSVENNWILNPSLTIQYHFTKNSKLIGNINENKRPISEDYIYRNSVITNNRNEIRNTPSLKLQRNRSASLGYMYYNLLKNIKFNSRLSYRESKGNFFSRYEITPTETWIQNFFLGENTEEFGINLFGEKLFYDISLVISLNSNYTKSNYKNIVNNSDLRLNISDTFQNTVKISSAYDFPINFETEFSHNYSKTKTENGDRIINERFENSTNLKIKISETISSNFITTYLLPNLNDTSHDYIFSDFNLNYRPKKSKLELGVYLKNILNEDKFRQITVNDYSKSSYELDLLPRRFIIGLSYTF
ncbi:TonB-dependent receptor [Aureivirga marina]|uniref:hypothetical protein n=1 Tax=Aureivirga marina TaxID=1182451 RepID=UPI0018C8DB97|nr:hypothetical protein [Aureivirga marina]